MQYNYTSDFISLIIIKKYLRYVKKELLINNWITCVNIIYVNEAKYLCVNVTVCCYNRLYHFN